MSNAGALFEMEDPAEFATGAGGGSDTLSSSRTAKASSSQPDSPFGVFDEAGIFRDDSRWEPTNDRAYQEEAQPPGFVQTLMRSAGSFIWVLLLIALSLSRSCSD